MNVTVHSLGGLSSAVNLTICKIQRDQVRVGIGCEARHRQNSGVRLNAPHPPQERTHAHTPSALTFRCHLPLAVVGERGRYRCLWL